jgi:transketolase N-terminal domain/subunit
MAANCLKQLRLVPADVEKVILNIKNIKSFGHDGVSLCVIKQLPKLFSKVLKTKKTSKKIQ